MWRGTPFAWMLLLLLSSAGCLAASGRGNPQWQEGEILSRRTIPPAHHRFRTRYVYRIKSGGTQYVARFDRPLILPPYSPLKFTVERRHLVVQDADGSEQKAAILKKSEPALRQ